MTLFFNPGRKTFNYMAIPRKSNTINSYLIFFFFSSATATKNFHPWLHRTQQILITASQLYQCHFWKLFRPGNHTFSYSMTFPVLCLFYVCVFLTKLTPHIRGMEVCLLIPLIKLGFMNRAVETWLKMELLYYISVVILTKPYHSNKTLNKKTKKSTINQSTAKG